MSGPTAVNFALSFFKLGQGLSRTVWQIIYSPYDFGVPLSIRPQKNNTKDGGFTASWSNLVRLSPGARKLYSDICASWLLVALGPVLGRAPSLFDYTNKTTKRWMRLLPLGRTWPGSAQTPGHCIRMPCAVELCLGRLGCRHHRVDAGEAGEMKNNPDSQAGARRRRAMPGPHRLSTSSRRCG